MITQQFQTIEWVIIRELIERLRHDGEGTVEEWASNRVDAADEVVEFVINVLINNRSTIQQAVQSDIQSAFERIQEHIQLEFGIEIEMDEEHEAQVLEYLNRDVIRSLPETVEDTYLSVVEHVQESEITGDTALDEVISVIILDDLRKGLKSGFFQSDGQQWNLDRLASHIEKRIYLDEYNHAWEHLRFTAVEIVRVHEFEHPRDACADLQISGIISIKPRETLSESAQVYPNIWDPIHKYMEIDGHHGIHCRHAWHHVDSSENRTAGLYGVLNDIRLSFELFRMDLAHRIERYIAESQLTESS